MGVEPEMVGPLLYQFYVVFASLDGSRGDTGEFACTGRINSSESATSVFTVAVHSKLAAKTRAYGTFCFFFFSTATFFQFELFGIDDCQSWKVCP